MLLTWWQGLSSISGPGSSAQHSVSKWVLGRCALSVSISRIATIHLFFLNSLFIYF